jgi:hypothetical protein
MATITFCDRCKSEHVTSLMNLYLNVPKGLPYSTAPQPDMRVDLCTACANDLERFIRRYEKVETDATST